MLGNTLVINIYMHFKNDDEFVDTLAMLSNCIDDTIHESIAPCGNFNLEFNVK